ncbi:MAG: methylenetetrahydrofolate--tRNA-(uracil(54)-C(5))-methyltransferase (FADH(2)-oxidizing) TrmFO [Bacilli bacterium]
MSKTINIVGAGLAGSEAAFYLAKKGYEINLYEMRPKVETGAHHTSLFGELVCSNSLKSVKLDNACGLLKEEMRHMNSLCMEAANFSSIEGGNSLNVDREKFAMYITEKLRAFPNIHIINEEVKTILDGITLFATGPLGSSAILSEIGKITGENALSFFDASAPIIEKDSINMDIAYRKSRYDEGSDSYINCPLSKEEYYAFVNELINAKKAILHEFDTKYFEGCMPVEVIASRGVDTLRFGPLKPKGLWRSIEDRSFAVVQLRQDTYIGDLYNIVGFQTNLTYAEQARVFRLIPGLENAKFVRYGLMHRNSYLNAPLSLKKNLELKNKENVFIAGQFCGVEGYVESAATGIYAAICIENKLRERTLDVPSSTMLGSLINYLSNANPLNFSPMNANFAIMYGARKNNREECITNSLQAIDKYFNIANEQNLS